MSNSLKRCIVILFLFLLLPMVATAAQIKKTGTIVFYPTDVTDAGDLAYLRDSLRLMLVSRIASAAGSDARLETKMVKERDLSFYRVMSRLAQTQDGIRISVEAYKPSDASPQQFHSFASDSAEIISALDLLVVDVRRSLFSAKDSSRASKIPGNSNGNDIDISTSHPDRAYKENSGFGLSILQDEFIAQMAIKVETTERFKSAFFPVRSEGMTAGDIDGDSLDEVLIATNTRLFIYQLRDLRIHHLETIPLPGGLNVHALNVADLDNNGLMEIYLSSTRDGEPRSFVLEWSPATGVKWLDENVYWYLRPMNIPGEGMVLAGQQNGFGNEIQPGVYRMLLEPGGKITKGERFSLPEKIKLFDFVFADLNGDKFPEIVTINDKEQLKVFNSAFELLYTSPTGFGGRELSEGLTVPIRLVVTDFDDDGNEDLLIVDNELYSPKMMSKTRLYKNGQVRGLLWDNDGFIEMWHTNLFPNSIVDFQLLSLTGDAKKGTNVTARLFILEPEKGDFLEAFLLGSGGNRLLVYGMEFISKENSGSE